MFRDVAAEFAELGVLVDETVVARSQNRFSNLPCAVTGNEKGATSLPLHICHGLDLARLRGCRPSRVVLHVRRQMCSEVAKVVVQVVGEEGILLRRQDNLLSIAYACEFRKFSEDRRRRLHSMRTLSSSRTSGTSSKLTRPFVIPRSS